VTIVRSGIQAIRQAIQREKARGQTIGFIPTMGFLHEGHLSLIRASASRGDLPIMSLFVNPTQFGPNEDLDSYPRNEERDIELATEAGAKIIWIPDTATLYPGGLDDQQIKVVPGSISKRLCGASRPVFFTGICTVVLKLFNLIQPDRAYFGEKDFQQLQIIRRMVEELLLEIEIVGCPIVRESDGLAMSSRNVRIPNGKRDVALHLSRTIQKARVQYANGQRDVDALMDVLQADWPEDLELDYMECRCSTTLELVTQLDSSTRLFLGAWLKDESGTRGVRLIDNAALSQG